MVIACSALDAVDVVAGFHAAHPAVEIALTEADSDRLYDGLRAGELDLAFAAYGGLPPPGIELQSVVEEAIAAAVRRDHPLASKRRVPLAALLEHRLISLPRGTGMRPALDRACARAGLEPRVGLEASDPRMLAELASRGLGVAVLPESLARAGELHAVVITPEMRGGLALAWSARGPASPAARALIDHARSALAEPLAA